MINQSLVYCPDQTYIELQNGLFRILERLFSVSFVFAEQDRHESVGELLGGVQPSTRNGSGVSTLKLPSDHCGLDEGKSIEIAVRFADDSCVPFPFRDRLFTTKVSVLPEALALKRGEVPLATCDLGPIWAYSETLGVKHFSSSLRLPILPAGGALQDLLGGDSFLPMLPLLEWLRQVSGSESYNDQGLRACFIFDDPNLHWTSYGFVDYKRLAEKAAAGNYHVCFATIPLDTWYTHAATAEIFRKHSKCLSLAIHGNDHTKRELGRAYSADERMFLLRQAIQRVERFERSTQLAVSRVMVPPHGACSEEMLAALPLCGFEAACISHGSLRAHNKTKAWTNYLGYLPSELVQGCPVLPRWGLAGDVTDKILRAAFFGQPIIIRGHHQDLRHGIELLDDLARVIHGLGKVTWSNLTDLARSNYQWRTDGTMLCLKSLGRKIVCSIPNGIEDLLIESSARGLSERWLVHGSNQSTITAVVGQHIPLNPSMGNTVSIEIAPRLEQSVPKVPIRPRSLALVRRFVTEGRDRFLSSA